MPAKKWWGFVFALLLCETMRVAVSAAQLRTGLDMLLQADCEILKYKRLALIANATSVDATGKSSLSLFQKHRLDLRVLFAPEHGFEIKHEAGKKISDATLSNGLKVISLYGKIKKPTREMLQDVDAIVFDVQDIGTRCYTYISTMKLAMEAAAEHQKEFILLDRPNPIAPIEADGMMLDTAFRSFVGEAPVPFIHSLTMGEIATLLQRDELPTLKLTVVKMRNYSRRKFADADSAWSSRFVPPSPNIQSVDAMILYPATVLLEGTNISEGRGTESPFEQIGAPFIDGVELKKELGNLSGIEVEPVSFVPKSLKGKSASPKFEGKRCGGVRFLITEREKVKPFEIAVALLVALNKLHSKSLVWNHDFFDKLAGTNRLRQMILKGESRQVILNAVKESCSSFEEKKQASLLY